MNSPASLLHSLQVSVRRKEGRPQTLYGASVDGLGAHQYHFLKPCAKSLMGSKGDPRFVKLGGYEKTDRFQLFLVADLNEGYSTFFT